MGYTKREKQILLFVLKQFEEKCDKMLNKQYLTYNEIIYYMDGKKLVSKIESDIKERDYTLSFNY